MHNEQFFVCPDMDNQFLSLFFFPDNFLSFLLNNGLNMNIIMFWMKTYNSQTEETKIEIEKILKVFFFSTIGAK